ncbi:tetratricopeptide repeat protein (macronuclear) [Tetrahymena thermophila SB210]|uniref:Tetratricopeptide repeat protein n=1 Tax=Tetrahymena thermophila (strain SB210) TaxID=312017 RepID=I7MH88_TETTS|nr:tetratricopeptide repeat protein [Tetrahymena thermophila SB210]EAS02705.1 tetratricopeptide repeat protein [Tetrahymena thermophila SB210]|eukprot:XP_001022950.1 tetratricopeptide repeat protein [Tetrahymena thermophila SB210]
MSEIVYKQESDPQTLLQQEVSQALQQKQIFQSVEIVQENNEEKTETHKLEQKLNSENSPSNSPGNPQEEEAPEVSKQSNEQFQQLPVQETSEEQEIDLQKTVIVDQSNLKSQEVTFTEKQEEKIQNEIPSNNEQIQIQEEVKQEQVQQQNQEDAQKEEQQQQQASSGTAEATNTMYTVDKRMQIANQYKDQARDLIKEKKYQDALVLYQQALDITNPTYFRYINEQTKIEYQQLSTQLLNNLAICYYNLGQYQIAAQISEQTLIIDPKNLKAMYRRAVCYKNLGDYERAYECIKNAVKSGGNESKDIYAEYENIKKLYKEYIDLNKEREKEVYGRMMNSSKVSEEKKKQQQQLQTKQDIDALINSLFFFGSSAMSFLVASKIMKVDVTSKTGFSLTGCLASSIYASYYFEKKWVKGVFGLCAALIFGYMYKKQFA